VPAVAVVMVEDTIDNELLVGVPYEVIPPYPDALFDVNTELV
jgi:hypothetical protein